MSIGLTMQQEDYKDTIGKLRKFVKLFGVSKVRSDIRDLDLNFYDEFFGHGMKPVKVVSAVMKPRVPYTSASGNLTTSFRRYCDDL